MTQYDVKKALLGGVIDYAGTFPPAALSLEKALERAATYRSRSAHPWLFGRVALPLEDIKKLHSRALYQAGADGSAWVFTALGNTASEPVASEFMRCVEWDVREIRRCRERWAAGPLRMEIVGYETKLPAVLERSQIDGYLVPALDRLLSLTQGDLIPYIEVPWEGDWAGRLSTLSASLSEWAEGKNEVSVHSAIKVRTGGSYVPTAAQLAAVISSCHAHGLQFKATQGLHSALTHGKDFGFVNLFFTLALASQVDATELEKCLVANDFVWEKNAISWGKHRLEIENIESARRRHGGCFGSCSLDEPDESLKEL